MKPMLLNLNNNNNKKEEKEKKKKNKEEELTWDASAPISQLGCLDASALIT
jgi:hypothetical protein